MKDIIMKNRTAVLIFCAFLLLVSSASAATYANVTPDTNVYFPGDTFTVDIYINPDEPIVGAEYKLHFNNSYLNATEQLPGPFLTQDGAFTIEFDNTIDNSNGFTSYAESIFGDPPVTTPNVLASVTFMVKETAPRGLSYLDLMDVIIVNGSAGEIPGVIVNNGTFEVPSVTITYPTEGQGINTHTIQIDYITGGEGEFDHAQLKLDSQAEVSDTDGSPYAFNDVPDGEHTVDIWLAYANNAHLPNPQAHHQVNFTVDTVTTVTIDPVTSPTKIDSQTVNGTMESGATVDVTSPTATVGAVSYPTATTWSVDISNMAEGDNEINATATDELGNTASAIATIVLDTITIVTIDPVTSPTLINYQTVTGTMEIGATVEVTSLTATVGAVSYPSETTWSVDLTDISEGDNIITANATDPSGNENSTQALIHISAIIYVVPGPGAIQAAIDAAEDYDFVYVYNGTYVENVDIWHPVVLMGESADNTTIDGNFTGLTVWVNSSNVSVSGFSIINGSNINIKVDYADDIEIFGNIIQSDNTWLGISVDTAISVNIHDNEISGHDAAIYTWDSNFITIQDNEIHDTHSGILLYSTNDATVTGNNMQNVVMDGVYVDNGYSNTISDNHFVGTGEIPDGGPAGIASVGDNGFRFFVWDGNDWSEVASEQFGLQYDTKTVLLEGAAPNLDGTYTIRITHSGDNIDAAHIDYLAIKKGDQEISPVSVVDAATGNNILYKVSSLDNDVADVRFKTIDVTWDVRSKDKLQVVMNAREEDIDSLVTVPFSYPVNFIPVLPRTYAEYVLSGNDVMNVDGELDGNLGEATFEEFYRPATGHPDGFTYYYLKNDADNLYVAVDVTADNTEDSFGDWVKIHVLVDGTPMVFEVVGSETQWGKSGFTYTDSVNWQHKVYEFQIPLDEIGASSGDIIQIAFEFYGTAGGSNSMIFLRDSDSNTITWNELDGNNSVYWGIKLESSDDNTISMNNETNSSIGLEIWNSMGNNIDNNQFSYNDYPGIYIQDSAGPQEIANNTVYGNLFGIYIEDPEVVNLIHHNIFYDNGDNGYDEYGTGQWDDSSEGNYWDDLPSGEVTMSSVDYSWINTTMEDTDWYNDTHDDDYSAKMAIPFEFVLDSVIYTDLQITSNGVIQLIPSGGIELDNDSYEPISYWIDEFPDETFIFAMSDDLDPGENGWYGYTYYPAGSNDSEGDSTGNMDLVVIDYRTPTYNDGPYEDDPNDFQVVLYANGTIRHNFNRTEFLDYDYDLESGIFLGRSSNAWVSIGADDYNAPESYEINVTHTMKDSDYDGIADFPYLCYSIDNNVQDSFPLVVASQATSPPSASGTGSVSFGVDTSIIDLANVGVNNIALWYKKDSGAWTHYSDSASGIFTFSTSSSGTYYFYTVSTDDVGMVEEVPETPDSQTTVTVSAKDTGRTGGRGGGGVGSDEPGDNINYSVFIRVQMTEGQQTFCNFDEGPVESIGLMPLGTYGLVTCKIEVLYGQSGSTEGTELPDGFVFQHLNIYMGNSGWYEGRISNPVINFVIPAGWFEENNIDPSSVTMYRYNDGEWQPLETTLTGQEGGYYQYSVQASGFSPFVIMGQTTTGATTEVSGTDTSAGDEVVGDKAETAPEATKKGIPGFGILLGAMGILIAIYARKK